jgi:D-alanyl-D-alanine carboxypeptidase (penicillin-binding protein 5/6)
MKGSQVKKNTAFIVLIVLILSFSFCLKISSAEPYDIPELTSESAVLMDARTGQVLFEKNMHKRQFPASTTKIMTGLLAVETAELNDMVTMSHDAVFSIVRGSSHIALDTGERLTLKEALYALSIESANDAANGIAEHISGDMKAFAEKMTERARELGALDTNFANAHGLDEDDHYTTAYDLALIMCQAIKYPEFNEVFAANYYEMTPTNLQSEPRYFHNRNSFLNGRCDYEGIVASKLGWTSKANNTLITAASRDGRDLVVAVMNNQAHNGTYEDTVKLFDYGFNEFNEVIVLSTETNESIPVLSNNQVEGNVNVKPAEPVRRLLHKSLPDSDFDVNYEILEYSNNEGFKTEVTFKLKQKSKYMYEDLGSLVIIVPVDPSIKDTTVWGNIKSFLLGLFKILKIVLMVVLALFVLLLILRQINQYRLRKKRFSGRGSYRINNVARNLNKDNDSYLNRYHNRDFDR